MGNIYEAKVMAFFGKHLHDNEEIRYICDSTGTVTCKSRQEQGSNRMRIYLKEICLREPSLRYIQAMRLSKEEPK
ncbi:hypothetical protein TrVFT333_010683 [Trichoderma virens FT-333]|nr:hypothetical protein TrVFT333_010683 [Trichoderma virens FT-333]